MITGPRLALVVLVVFATVTVPVSAAQSDTPDIEGVTFGNNSVGVEGNATILWQAGEHQITTNVTDFDSGGYELCATTKPQNGSSTELGCTPIRENGTETISFNNWSGPTGRQEVTLTVSHVLGDGSAVANQTAEVHVLVREADEDGDSLSNEREVKLGTDLFSPDTDQDGIEDGAEVNTYETDPLSNDTDDDGLRDLTEVGSQTNATDPDTDGDGLLDGPEVNEYGTNPVKPDTDGDGLSDSAEVLRYGTDPLEADTDGDGLSDSAEIRRYGTNPLKVHSDGDGLSDGTEVALGTWPGSALDVVIIALVAVTLAGLGVWALLRRRTDEVATDQRVETEVSKPPAIESDEERILNLLREETGSIPQKEIVESTEWSSSKVSRLLSKMAEEGLVTKTTIGRENYIRLAENGTNDTADK